MALRSARSSLRPAVSFRPFSAMAGINKAPTFDTNKVVKSLKEKGFTDSQAEGILEVLRISMLESLDSQAQLLATKNEHVELKAELNEKVFNSTLKFDIAQRHTKELLERDFNNLKQEIRMLESHDFALVKDEINALEKRFLVQKQKEDEIFSGLSLDIEKVEKRMLQYAVGFAGTIMAVGAGIARLIT